MILLLSLARMVHSYSPCVLSSSGFADWHPSSGWFSLKSYTGTFKVLTWLLCLLGRIFTLWSVISYLPLYLNPYPIPKPGLWDSLKLPKNTESERSPNFPSSLEALLNFWIWSWLQHSLCLGETPPLFTASSLPGWRCPLLTRCTVSLSSQPSFLCLSSVDF